ncbi:MAG: RNA polymerase sigma factor [Acidobacteriota bacterium]
MPTQAQTRPEARDERAVQACEELGELFGQLARGQLAALDAVYDLTATDLYGLALWRAGSHEDACDAVQDVFVRLARTGADLARVRDPRAYLFAMAHRAAIDVLRKRREHVAIDENLVEPATASHEGKVEAAQTWHLLKQLPASQREAIYLRHFDGLSFAEIGKATRVPLFTAASRYRLGMRRLRRLMGVER